MNKAEFDNIIKRNVVKKNGKDEFGYVIDGKTYKNYYTKEVFEKFKNTMEKSYSEYYKDYDIGTGSEFKEKKGKYGWMPPKMASVASSSRFCYLALRDGAQALGGDNVKFEYECIIEDIEAKTYPQLDAYIEESHTFVEAKCHEIFDSHKIKMSKKYEKYLTKDFGITLGEDQKNSIFEIPLSEFGIEKSTSRFDIKQLLCHLIGIKSEKKRLEVDEVTLTYLFFKPKTNDENVNEQIDEVFEELTDEINKIFSNKHICRFISNNNIHLNAVAEYSEIMEPLNSTNIIKISIN